MRLFSFGRQVGYLLYLMPFWSLSQIIHKEAMQLDTRFEPPTNFQRLKNPSNSFAHYLQTLPLKSWGEKVRYFDGSQKLTPDVYVSVIDLPIGKRDLHQCADAVMRLRAEYLYKQKKYDQIHFNFLADGKPRYFVNYAKGDFSDTRFWKYMEYIFASANTRSLHAELKPVPMLDMKIGDVFIQKGVPFGHAVIVIDMAENPATKQKLYLLAQSYMPAQEIQVLVNPNNSKISPWYELKNESLKTPEWSFQVADLRRF